MLLPRPCCRVRSRGCTWPRQLYTCRWLAFLIFGPALLAFASVPTKVTPELWQDSHITGDLPLLSEEHGPNGTEWRNSVAVCATMKHENSTDVREWLFYYRWLGVEHVYLTENAELLVEPTAQLRAELDDFVDDGFLTYLIEPEPRSQLKVYYDCMVANQAKYNWLAFFDLDEFLVLRPGEAQRLPDFLDEYRQHAGLSVHWVLVGPSGRHTRPRSGGVLRHYTECSGKGRGVVKTIANTYFLTNIATHPHNFEFRGRARTVDELAQPMASRDRRICLPPDVEPEPGFSKCYHDASAARKPTTVTKVALFHYATRSRQDYAAKLARGSAMSRLRRKSWETFNQIARETQAVGGLCGLPAAAAAECCPQEALVLQAAA